MKNIHSFFYVIFFLIFSTIGLATNHHTFLDSVKVKTIRGSDDRGTYHLEYPAINKFGEKLNNLLKKSITDNFMCYPDPDRKTSMMVETKVRPTFLSKNIFSYSIKYNSYCGGAYPNAGIKYVIFDLKNKKIINSRNQFKNYNKFKVFISKQFKKIYSKKIKSNCRKLYSEKKLALTSLDFLLTQKNIVARTEYPHVDRVCERNIFINCNDLQPYLRKGSIFNKYCFEVKK